MEGKITSSELVGILHYRDRWEEIAAGEGGLLVSNTPAYAGYWSRHNDYVTWIEVLYNASLADSEEEVLKTITDPKFFVLCFQLHPNLSTLLSWYSPDSYRGVARHSALLHRLSSILQTIQPIIDKDRNQLVTQVISFCEETGDEQSVVAGEGRQATIDDLFAAFCISLKRLFPSLPLIPLPGSGFREREALQRQFTNHQLPVKAVRSIQGGQLLVSADSSRIFIWRVDSGEVLCSRETDENGLDLTALEIAEDRQLIMAVFREGVGIAWRWKDFGKKLSLDEISRVKGERAFLDILYLQDDRAVIATTSGHLLFWDIINGKVEKQTVGLNSLRSLALTPRGELIVSGGADLGPHEQMVFKLFKKNPWWELYCSPAHEWPVGTVYGVSESEVLSISNYIVSLYDWRKGKLLMRKDYKQTLHGSCYIPEKRLLLVARSHSILVLDLNTHKEKEVVTRHHSMITDILAKDAGRLVITASDDQTVRIWQGDQFLEKSLSGLQHTDEITSLVPAGAWNYILSSSYDGKVIVWDRDTLRPVRSVQAHKHWVQGIQVIEKQAAFISYSWDHCIHFWDLYTFEKTRSIRLEGKHFKVLHYHTGLDTIVFITPDHQVWTYDITRGMLANVAIDNKIIRFFFVRGTEYLLISNTGRIWSFDLAEGKVSSLHRLPVKKCVEAFYEQATLYLIDDKNCIRQWKPGKKNSRKLQRMLTIPTGLIRLADGRLLTINGRPHYLSDNTLRIHDTEGKSVVQFTLESPLTACTYMEAYRLICVGDSAGGIYFFSLNQRGS